MKRISLLLIVSLCLLYTACSKKSYEPALLITSESSVGIRAFQGQVAAEGKLVLQNVGSENLTNLQLILLNPSVDVSFDQGSCTNSLKPQQTCDYLVHYKPKFNPPEKDNVQNSYITFEASATDESGVKVQDSYTLILQRVAQDSWVKLGDMSSMTPTIGKMLVVKKGSANLLYAACINGICRSSDAKHWSMVGNNNLQSATSLLLGKNSILYAATEEGVKKYDGKNWSLVGKLFTRKDCPIKATPVSLSQMSNGNLLALIDYHWDTYSYTDCSDYDSKLYNQGVTIMVYDGNNWRPINATNWPHDWQAKTNLMTDNDNNLYVGAQISGTNSNVLKFDGNAWSIVGRDSWQSHVIEEIQQQGQNLYAATDLGVIKFNGKVWSLLGADTWKSAFVHPYAIAKNATMASTLLLENNGDLYAGTVYGVMHYNAHTQVWSNLFKGWNDLSSVAGDYYGWVINLINFNNELYAMATPDVANGSNILLHYKDNDWVPATSAWTYPGISAVTQDESGNLYARWDDATNDVRANGKYFPVSGVVKYENQGWTFVGSSLTQNLPNINFSFEKNKLYNIDNHEILVSKAIGWKPLLNNADLYKNFHFVNDIALIQGTLYAAWGNCMAQTPGRPLDDPLLCSNYRFASSADNTTTTDAVEDATDMATTTNQLAGTVTKYVNKEWIPIGNESWQEQDFGPALALQEINGILYAAVFGSSDNSIAVVLSYDGKNWSPIGVNTWNANLNPDNISDNDSGYFTRSAYVNNLIAIKGILYAAGKQGVYQYYQMK